MCNNNIVNILRYPSKTLYITRMLVKSSNFLIGICFEVRQICFNDQTFSVNNRLDKQNSDKQMVKFISWLQVTVISLLPFQLMFIFTKEFTVKFNPKLDGSVVELWLHYTEVMPFITNLNPINMNIHIYSSCKQAMLSGNIEWHNILQCKIVTRSNIVIRYQYNQL